MFTLRPNSIEEDSRKRIHQRFKSFKKERIGSSWKQDEGRHTWDSQFQSFIYGLGYCVGVGNIWRFPYLCFKYGMVFLIPYIIFLICIGHPMMFLELLLGQYMSQGPVFVFSELAPIWKGIGWSCVIVSYVCSIYYNLILSWILHYLWTSIVAYLSNGPLPWDTCPDQVISPNCFTLRRSKECFESGLVYWNNTCVPRSVFCQSKQLKMDNLTHCYDEKKKIYVDFEDNGTFAPDCFFKTHILGQNQTSDESGSLNSSSLIFYTLAWVMVMVFIARSVRSSGKIAYLTVTVPYFILFYLLLQGDLTITRLIGVMSFDDSILNREMWKDAANQVLFSLGISFGSIPTIASYNGLQQNILRDSYLLVFYNMVTSLLCTTLMYSSISQVSTALSKDIHEIVNIDPGLPFKIYSSAVVESPLLAIVFFLMLFTMGIDTQMVMVETVVSTFQDQLNQSPHRRLYVVFGTCMTCYILGVTMCIDGMVMDIYYLLLSLTGNLALFVIGFFEVISVAWIYDFDNTVNIMMKKLRLPISPILKAYLKITWKYITPSTFFGLMILAFIDLFQTETGGLRCFASGISTIVIIIGALFAVYQSEDYNTLFTPTVNCCTEGQRQKNFADRLSPINISTRSELPSTAPTFESTRHRFNPNINGNGQDNEAIELNEL